LRGKGLAVLFLVLVTLISYYPALYNDFTNWDDDRFLTQNPLVQRLSARNIKQMFTSAHHEYYGPLFFLSFAVEYRFFGANPFHYHLDNVILHAANAILVFFLLYLLTERVPLSLVAATIFAVHPIHVESVAWVTERKDVLCGLFFLLSLIFYLLFRKGSRRHYLLCLLFFICALLSKPTAVMLPVILILLDFLLGERQSPRTLLNKAPFFLIAVIFAYITIATQRESAMPGAGPAGAIGNFLVAARAVVFYIEKTILPLALSAHYPFPTEFSFAEARYYGSLIALVIIAAFVLFSLRYTRRIFFGFAFFIAMLLPVLQIVRVGDLAAADRYMYLPLIGPAYIFALVIDRWVFLPERQGNVLRAGVIVLLAAMFFALGNLTYRRCKVWKNSLTLWSDVLEQFPESAPALLGLGKYYKAMAVIENRDENIAEAEKFLKKLYELYPDRRSAVTNLASLYLFEEKPALSIPLYEKAVRLYPDSPEARLYLANAYSFFGMYRQARKEYMFLVEDREKELEAYLNLAKIAAAEKDFTSAIEWGRKAVEANGECAEAYIVLAGALYGADKFEEAAQWFEEAMRRMPRDAGAVLGAAEAYRKLGRYREALARYEQAASMSADISKDEEYIKGVEEVKRRLKNEN